MREFILGGRVLDFVMAMTLIEALALLLIHRRTGRGPAPIDTLGLLAAGFCLALAFRLSTLGADWIWIALALTGALLSHLLDLARRWRK